MPLLVLALVLTADNKWWSWSKHLKHQRAPKQQVCGVFTGQMTSTILQISELMAKSTNRVPCFAPQLPAIWPLTPTLPTQSSSWPTATGTWLECGHTVNPLITRTGLSTVLRSCAGRDCSTQRTGRWRGAVAPTSASPTTASPDMETRRAVSWDTTTGPGVWSVQREATHRATITRGSGPARPDPSPTESGFTWTGLRALCPSTASLRTLWSTFTPSRPPSLSLCTRVSGSGHMKAQCPCVMWC